MKKIIVALVIISFTTCRPQPQKLTVAVAANMQYAMDALIQEYHKTSDTQIEIVLGASGKLTQQMTHGAPFDMFISADKAFPGKLAASHLTIDSPKVYAKGALVLWTTRPDIIPVKELDSLKKPSIQRIAIANPQTAPYGSAAERMLKNAGLYDSVLPKLVTGESITQASQFIATGSADIGFTAKAIVIQGEMKNKGKWVELDVTQYPPVEQAAVILAYARKNNLQEAERFYNFLYSAQAKAIYQQFGYLLP